MSSKTWTKSTGPDRCECNPDARVTDDVRGCCVTVSYWCWAGHDVDVLGVGYTKQAFEADKLGMYGIRITD